MESKIKVEKPLVILHGDEMAQIAFERILQQFVHQRLDIELIEIDLTAENRLITNGQAVVEAIDHETRVVTVRGPGGNTITFTASDEVRNLDQVAAGDLIDAEYVESLDVEVLPAEVRKGPDHEVSEEVPNDGYMNRCRINSVLAASTPTAR